MTSHFDYDAYFDQECKQWLLEQVDGLTDEIVMLSPSEWAEKNRYLPASVTPMPGYYSYDVNPALREIIDCGDLRSPIREVNFKKVIRIVTGKHNYFIG